jgi:hypothetical protein
VVAGGALGIRGQPVHRFEQLVDERVPAKLSVGDDVHAGSLLHRDHLVDRAVFDLLVDRGRHLPGLELPAGPDQVVGPQQRADGVGAIHGRHLLIRLIGRCGTAML